APYPSFAAELPAEVPPGAPAPAPAPAVRPSSRRSYDLGAESLGVPSPVRGSPRTSDDGRPVSALSSAPTTAPASSAAGGGDRLTSHAPTPAQYWTAGGRDKIAIVAADEAAGNGRMEPPPLPPKTPIIGGREHRRGPSAVATVGMGPPYPLDDGPPPVVNMARKPEWNGR
ncbi:hypothetical protein V496_03519, partial [Pseudogymnoascus sp. VKM F-4515 (FW-2607)]